MKSGLLHSSHIVLTHSTKVVISAFLVFELHKWRIVSTTATWWVGRLATGQWGALRPPVGRLRWGSRGSKRFRPCHQGEPHGPTTAARVKRRPEGKLGESHIALAGADCTPVIWNLSQLYPGKTRRLLSCRRLVKRRAYHNTCANAYVHGMEE